MAPPLPQRFPKGRLSYSIDLASMADMKVAVLGASPKKDRYSNRALHELSAAGHEVIGVNPSQNEIDGFKCVARLSDLPKPVHTITVYVGPDHISPLIDEIIAARPERVIMNPGAESPALSKRLSDAGIPLVEGCTLVMLRTKTF